MPRLGNPRKWLKSSGVAEMSHTESSNFFGPGAFKVVGASERKKLKASGSGGSTDRGTTRGFK